MGKEIIEMLTSASGNPATQLAEILTIWALLFVGIASFFQIKSHYEIKTKIREEAERVATNVAKKKAAETIKNSTQALINRLTLASDLAMEFSEYRGNAWKELTTVMFAIIDEPSLNLEASSREVLKTKIKETKKRVFDISYESSYLLQLFDKDSSKREAARAYVRDHKIVTAIRLLHMQYDSFDLENLSREEKDDITYTIREIESK